MNPELIWNEDDERFEAHFGNDMAWINYASTPHGIDLLHTEVPLKLSGHGYSQLLARFALDSLASRGIKAIVSCPTVRHFIDKHPQYQSVVYVRSQSKSIAMENYQTLKEAIDALRAAGYTVDFNIGPDHLRGEEREIILHPDDFHVDLFYRFEDNTDPSDESVLYAISSEKHGIKGILVNAFGIYSDQVSDMMMKKLKMH
jgi:predicted GNAT family acetyltransferase